MQKLYNLNDLAAATGIHRHTLGVWTDNKWLVPCDYGGCSRFYHQAEYDRIMSAIAEASGAPRQVHLILNRTLHTARKFRALNTRELAGSCGCCKSTLVKALASLGYPSGSYVAVLEDDVAEVKAAVDRVRALGHKSRAEGRRKAAVAKPGATGSITVHLKGLSISLTHEDANALAEELISQL